MDKKIEELLSLVQDPKVDKGQIIIAALIAHHLSIMDIRAKEPVNKGKDPIKASEGVIIGELRKLSGELPVEISQVPGLVKLFLRTLGTNI